MAKELSRREFMGAGVALAAMPHVPEIWIKRAVNPVVIASGNGHQFRNGGEETCVQTAFRLMTSGPTPAWDMAVCRTPTEWCSWIPVACMGRRNGREASPALKEYETRQRSR